MMMATAILKLTHITKTSINKPTTIRIINIINNRVEMGTTMNRKLQALALQTQKLTRVTEGTIMQMPTIPMLRKVVTMKASKGIKINTIMTNTTTKVLLGNTMAKEAMEVDHAAVGMTLRKTLRPLATSP